MQYIEFVEYLSLYEKFDVPLRHYRLFDFNEVARLLPRGCLRQARGARAPGADRESPAIAGPGMPERRYAISPGRRLSHPSVVLITDTARTGLFAA